MKSPRYPNTLPRLLLVGSTVIASALFSGQPAGAQTIIPQAEPDDSIGTANPTGLIAGSSAGGIAMGNNGDGPFGITSGDGTGDTDFYSVDVNVGQVLTVDVNASEIGSTMDSVIGIYNGAGVLLGSNDDDQSLDSYLEYTAAVTETLFVAVASFVTGGAEASLPADPTTPGTGVGSPGSIDDYEVIIGLDLEAHAFWLAPAFPVISPVETALATLTIENRGTAAMTFTELSFSGPGAANFSASLAAPLTINPNLTGAIAITFNPQGSDELKTASIELLGNDTTRPTLAIPLEARAIEGLLMRLAFDDPPGSPLNSFAAPLDISGNGNLAAYVVNSSNPVFGQPPVAQDGGTSVLFSDAGGTANYALTSNAFPHVPSFSCSLWIRRSAASGGVDTLFNRDPGFSLGDTIFGCNISADGTLNFRVAGAEVVSSAPGAIVTGQDYHIVVTHLDTDGFGTFVSDRTRLYINGNLVSENSEGTAEIPQYDAAPTNSRLWIATRSAAGTGFGGNMDDFQWYNIELLPEQVDGMFADPGSVAAPPSPLAFTEIEYDFDSDSVALVWTTRTGKEYSLEVSDGDLVSFVELEDGLMGVEGFGTYTDEFLPKGVSKRFYRVQER